MNSIARIVSLTYFFSFRIPHAILRHRDREVSLTDDPLTDLICLDTHKSLTHHSCRNRAGLNDWIYENAQKEKSG